MRNDYLDKLTDYIALKSDRHYEIDNGKYLSLNNFNTPAIIFLYAVYCNKKGITYSANLYYWYYLLLMFI